MHWAHLSFLADSDAQTFLTGARNLGIAVIVALGIGFWWIRRQF